MAAVASKPMSIICHESINGKPSKTKSAKRSGAQ